MKSYLKQKNSGFTLIELLVVIAIIALLLAILMPSLRKAKEVAQAVVCTSNLRQWNILVGFFLNDNGGTFPDADWNDDDRTDPHGQWWIQPFKQYNDTMDILLCAKAKTLPKASRSPDDARPPQSPKECWGSLDKAPSPTANEWTFASYAPNAWMMKTEQGTWGASLGKDVFWGKIERVTAPYQVPLFLDSRWVDVWPSNTDTHGNEEGTGNGSMKQVALTRHGLKTGVVFMDGSATRVDIKGLWGLKWHRDFETSNPYSRGEIEWPIWMK